MTSTPHEQPTQSPAPTLSLVHDLLSRLDPQRVEPCGVPGCIHVGVRATGHGPAERLMAA